LARWDEDVYDIKPEEKDELRAAMLKIRTVQVEEWERRYHSTDPKEQSFGGKMIITLKDGSKVEDEKACANAHPLGSTPWKRPQYIKKLESLTKDFLGDAKRKAFLDLVDTLEKQSADKLAGLTPEIDLVKLDVLKT